VRNKQTEETLWKAEQEQAGGAEIQDAPGILEKAKLEGINFKAGLERYGTEATYTQVLRSYATHTQELLEKLRSLSQETLPDYMVTVHGLKGASYGVCAEAIGKEAEELEFAAKAGDYKKVALKNAAFIAKVEASLKALGGLLQADAEGSGEKPKAVAPDKALLEKLLDASKRFKPAIMEDVLAELEGYEYESEGDLIPWLREQIDNLEYDAVREKLESFSV
jgi:HPt (histidine-containing phosphotransfer) domain-containing protein